MSDITDIIKDFTISKRINEAATSFSITFNTSISPDEFATGETFEFTITDNTLYEGYTAISGIIEGIERDNKENNQIYKITGRDKGRLLLKQPYELDCNTETPTLNNTIDILTSILTNTGITIGRGQKPLAETIYLTTDGTSKDRYCGSWNTKQDAINQLFNQYTRLSGASTFRWYIDVGGNFRWFELNTSRGNKEYIFNDDSRVLSFTVKEDATNIMNDITGFYGPEEDGTSVHIQNSTSITTYGLCYGQPVTETQMTQAEITTKLQREIDQKSVPIYSATLELDGFYDMEPGTQVLFPDDPYYDTTTFTIVDRTLKGEPGKPRTTFNLTTDPNSISITNEFEVIQATAQKEVQDNKAQIGVVESVPSSGDRFTALVAGQGSQTSIPARNVGGQFLGV